MDDLFKKLNVIVKATLNDMLTGDSKRSKLPGDNTDQPLSTKDAEAQLVQLRKRVDETLAFESELEKQIAQLEADIEDWNGQADNAVERGDDASARHAVAQAQRLQERLNMVRSDLVEHERVTQSLIYHVNTLDAAVTRARQNEGSGQQPSLDEKLGSVLQEMRDKISELRDQLTDREAIVNPDPEPNTKPESTTSIEDDLAKRRQRLSKPE